MFNWLGSALFLSLAVLAIPTVGHSADDESLKVVWLGPQGEQVLGNFKLSELPASARKKSKEQDPQGGEVVQWEGYLLSALIEHAWSALSVDQRATVDLILLKGKDGASASVPRVIVDKNPVILAVKRKGQPLGARGPIFSVAPWTSQSKLKQEPLPWERYFVSNVQEIVLTNAQTEYGNYFLSKRSDPRALRGERLFVQGCVGCHDSSVSADKKKPYALTLAKGVEHKAVPGLPHFSANDQKALQSYFKELGNEVVAQK
jgi:hypothetical protein